MRDTEHEDQAHSLLRIRPAITDGFEYRVSRTWLHCHRLRTYCVYYRRGRDARVQESVAQLEQHQDRYLANANIG